MNKFRILIVDDHGIVRAGIRSMLESNPEFEIVGEASGGEEAIANVRDLQPDLVLMDIAMPGMNGIEATRRIKEEWPEINVLVLTMHDDEEFFFPVLKAGASGYVLKEAEPQELLYAISVVRQGAVFLTPSISKTIVRGFIKGNGRPEGENYRSLTPREKEVLNLAATGRTNREIAETLFLSIRTIEKHRQSGMHKLGLERREDLTRYALRMGLISTDELK